MLQIEKIWLTDSEVWIRTSDGREACERFEHYPRLRFATRQQRERYEVSNLGIHWPDMDEDLCFEGFFRKSDDTELYKFFMAHPELNAAVVARRLGLSQSLFAQYISGTKHPSKEQAEKIREEIRKIGAELANI